MTKEKELEKLNQEIRNCKKCPLWKTRRNAVPGEGDINAKIMFIGESPGREENLSGKPFCGMAGKFLDKLFKENKIDRKKVFITSVLKCRPVIKNRNRSPKATELEACKIWLQNQIEIIKPKLIVLLGKIAFDTVIGKKEFKELQGKFLIKNRQKYFPTYHPAAGMRFPKIRKALEKDFKKLRKFN